LQVFCTAEFRRIPPNSAEICSAEFCRNSSFPLPFLGQLELNELELEMNEMESCSKKSYNSDTLHQEKIRRFDALLPGCNFNLILNSCPFSWRPIPLERANMEVLWPLNRCPGGREIWGNIFASHDVLQGDHLHSTEDSIFKRRYVWVWTMLRRTCIFYLDLHQ